MFLSCRGMFGLRFVLGVKNRVGDESEILNAIVEFNYVKLFN